MKACRDCRHYDSGDMGSTCEHPALLKDDPIHGKVMAWPWREREPGHACGPEAAMFEAKPSLRSRIARMFGLSSVQ